MPIFRRSLNPSGDLTRYRKVMSPPFSQDRQPVWSALDGVDDVVSFARTAGKNGRPRMLVVDGDDGPRASVRIVFRHRFDVLAVDSSPLALAACELRCFDVAISDFRRAGISGLDCLEEMRRMGCGAPVIFLTAYATRDRIRRAFALGAYDVIDKPFSVLELQQAVAMAMGMEFAE